MLNKRLQNKLMLGITISMVPFAAFTAATAARENRVFAASITADGEIHAGTTKAPENGQIGRESAMPCEDREAFRRWYEEHRAEYEPETEAAEPEEPKIYTIGGGLIDPEIQRKLYQALEAEGIGYWYTGALAQMWQESQGRPEAVNPNNGIDCGLYQYRITYWTEPADIFDVDAQLQKYAKDMAARFNAGLTADEAISRHNTSDFVTDINWTYVQQVRQHLATMEVIE